jgi:acyl phosphate:glycerol-3-phosphate acyltransferase
VREGEIGPDFPHPPLFPMEFEPTHLLRIFACFAIGAIPFAKVAMLGTGIDITKVGSRNPGFNNVLRVSTKPRAAIALIGDICKGFVAVLLLSRGVPVDVAWMMGIAAVAGHCWSPFCGWNGGKGVATTVGVLLVLSPKITLICLPLYVIGRWFGRRMGWKQEGAISSLTTMFVLATLVFTIPAYVMFAIVFIRHIPNLKEIFAKR